MYSCLSPSSHFQVNESTENWSENNGISLIWIKTTENGYLFDKKWSENGIFHWNFKVYVVQANCMYNNVQLVFLHTKNVQKNLISQRDLKTFSSATHSYASHSAIFVFNEVRGSLNEYENECILQFPSTLCRWPIASKWMWQYLHEHACY